MNYKEKKILTKQVNKLIKKEKKILDKKDCKFLKDRTDWIKDKLNEKVPDKVTKSFEMAFHKAFYIVFEKGTDVIEKTMSLKKIENEYDINQYILQKEITVKNIKRIDQDVNKGVWMNTGISTVKNFFLGLLGIGLPDIPVFIAMILKTIYEIGLRYGFSYDSDHEKIYILYIICAANARDEKRVYYSNTADSIALAIDQNMECKLQLNDAIEETAKQLSASVVGTKVLQGVAIIGVCGGIADFKVLSDISTVAKLKYKKRFLRKMNMTKYDIAK